MEWVTVTVGWGGVGQRYGTGTGMGFRHAVDLSLEANSWSWLPLLGQPATFPAWTRLPAPLPAQVNPLAETDTALVAADAKLGFDDNASFRQKDLFAMRDESQEDPRWVGLGGALWVLLDVSGWGGGGGRLFAMRDKSQEDPRWGVHELLGWGSVGRSLFSLQRGGKYQPNCTGVWTC